MALAGRAPEKISIGRRQAALVLCVFLSVSAYQPSVALVGTHDGCTWPGNWPKALEEVTNSCRTIEFMTGIQENIYETVFDDREKFERLWPVLLSVKTPGAPIRLCKIEILPEGSLTSNAKPTVRIFGPSDGVTTMPPEAGSEARDTDRLLAEGQALRSSPPWPATIVSANGELPEYVQAMEENGRLTWVPGSRDHMERGFLYRARVELEMVVDEKVIDLNRIPLPSGGPFIDRRYDPKP